MASNSIVYETYVTYCKICIKFKRIFCHGFIYSNNRWNQGLLNLPYSIQNQQNECQILVQTLLEELDTAQNLAPMISEMEKKYWY